MASARRIGAMLAVTAAALAAFAVTQTTDTSSVHADSVWSVPADTPATPSPAPTTPPIAAPQDSVW